VTEVLTLLDYAYKRAFLDGAHTRIGQILAVRRLVEFAILDVINQSYKSLDNSQSAVQEAMADRILTLANERGVALISTNYDELLEFQIYSALIRPP